MRFLAMFGLVSLLACSIRPSRLNADEGTHHTFRYLTSAGYPTTFHTLAFSPDSRQLAVSAGGKLDILDLNSGREARKYEGSPHTIGYSADGKRMHLISQYRGRLIDADSGGNLQSNSIVVPGYIGVTLEQRSGKLLFQSMHKEGPVAATGKINIGDELIAISEGRNGKLRNITGQSVTQAYQQMKGAAGTYLQLKVLPSGRYGEQHARVHAVRRLHRQQRGGHFVYTDTKSRISENLVRCMVNGKHQLRATSTGQPIAHLQTIDIENIGQATISPTQQLFAIVSRQKEDKTKAGVEVFDIATQERVTFMPMPKDDFSDIAISPNNRFVFVATWDSVEVGDIDRGRFVSRLDLGWKAPKPKPKKQVRNANSVSNILTATAGEIESGGKREVGRSPRNLAWKVAISSNNVVATADNSGHVKLWDLSGILLKEMPGNSAKEPQALEFSPDGKWLTYHIEGVLHVVDVSGVEPLSIDKALARLENMEDSANSDIVLQMRRWLVLADSGRSEEADQLLKTIDGLRREAQERLVEKHWERSTPLNGIAWRIALGPEPKNLDLAKRAATRAFEMDSENALIADTLARVYFEMDDLDGAVAVQKQAVGLRPYDDELRQMLQKYQAANTARGR